MLKEVTPHLYESYRAQDECMLVYWHGADEYLGIVHKPRNVGMYFNRSAAKDLLQSIKDALESQPEGE